MCMRLKTIAAGLFVLIGFGGPAAAVTVDWDNAFLLQTNGGIANPAALVGFNPVPEPPGDGTLVDLTDPMAPTWTTVGGISPVPFRILFGLFPGSPIRFNAPGTPDATGHYEFQALDATSGASLFNIIFDVESSSGGVPDGSWVGFNPQPEPPAFSVGEGGTIGFDFEFTSLSFGVLKVQIEDAQGNALGFSPVPLPAAAWMFLTALGGLGLFGWRRKRATA